MAREPGGHRRETLLAAVRSVVGTGVVVAAYYLLPLDAAFTARTVITLIGGLAAVALLLFWQVRVIMRSPRPQLRAVEAVATALPLFLLLFAAVYYLLERSTPESFSESLSRTDALYFTMTVFSTVGFGDISPHSEPARVLATGQMAVDLVLLGVVARYLVGAVQEGMRQQQLTAPDGGNGSSSDAR
ncbi:potassium channel family protein [Kitasatospora purpeofusca]|uniref:Potassium channel family protein n=1 Tax=Kitasatospora purpeofusca TaxID=67352 RepID=A0ABZ1TSD1_9ACTN|nr:potassium channel family protein [Kitasatospora purpeofusca]